MLFTLLKNRGGKMEAEFNKVETTFFDRDFNRREVLKIGAASAASLALYDPLSALASYREPIEKKLSFYNTHTGESLQTIYRSAYQYIPENLRAINHIMRDHRTGEVKEIDTRLLELLNVLSMAVDSKSPFYIISGYRSPESNRKLMMRSSRVAKRSMHMYGKAVDISLPDCKLKDLKAAAMKLGGGGVGYYPDARFVHVDVGRVRYW